MKMKISEAAVERADGGACNDPRDHNDRERNLRALSISTTNNFPKKYF